MNLLKRTVMYRCGVAAASPSAWLSASLSEVAVEEVAVEEVAVVAVLDVEVEVAVMTMAASAAVLPKLSTLYRSPAEVWLCLLSKLVAQSKQSGDHTHTHRQTMSVLAVPQPHSWVSIKINWLHVHRQQRASYSTGVMPSAVNNWCGTTLS